MKYVANDRAIVSLENVRMVVKTVVKVDRDYLPAIEIRYIDRQEESFSFSGESKRDEFYEMILAALMKESI